MWSGLRLVLVPSPSCLFFFFFRILKFSVQAVPFYCLHLCSVLVLKMLSSELGLGSYYCGRIRGCLSSGKVPSLIFP